MPLDTNVNLVRCLEQPCNYTDKVPQNSIPCLGVENYQVYVELSARLAHTCNGNVCEHVSSCSLQK